MKIERDLETVAISMLIVWRFAAGAVWLLYGSPYQCRCLIWMQHKGNVLSRSKEVCCKSGWWRPQSGEQLSCADAMCHPWAPLHQPPGGQRLPHGACSPKGPLYEPDDTSQTLPLSGFCVRWNGLMFLHFLQHVLTVAQTPDI